MTKSGGFEWGACPPRAQFGAPPRQTMGTPARESNAKTDFDAPLRIRTSERIDSAPWDQQELKRNKFRAPKIVAVRQDFTP